MKNFENVRDEELVRQYISTQRNPYFEELYERYAQKVYRKCYSFVQDQSKAEDYTHDIFIKIATKLGSFKEDAKFGTWLYAITYNYCLDRIRKEKRAKEEKLDDHYDIAAEEEDNSFSQMQSEGLKKSLAMLSHEERSILLMKYQDDFSIKEISESMELTESAVKMRLKRTKEKVKKLYLENVVLFFIMVLKLFMILKK